LDNAVVSLSWLPIPYIGNSGHYKVLGSQTAGGPYSLIAQTANKTASSFQVTGLVPGETYYFVVQTHTDAHSANANALDSEYSAEVSATAWLQVHIQMSGAVAVGGQPLAGVIMNGLPAGTVTNASGAYAATLDAGWTGVVTPELAGYVFTPATRAYAGLTTDQAAQDFSARLLAPSITVTSPNGGESWAPGSAQTVSWTAVDLAGTVTIDLYKGGVYRKTLGTADAAAGTLAWAIAADEEPGTDYRVLVWQGGVSDDSDGDFRIQASVRVDFNKDGREDILWRYYGTGGRDRAWFLGGTTSEFLLLTSSAASPELALSQGPDEPVTDAASFELLEMRSSIPRMTVMSVADPREAASAGAWSETRSGSRKRTARGSDVAIDMGPASTMPSFREPSFAVIETVTAAAPASDPAAILAGTALLGGADILAVPDLTWQIVGTGDFNKDGSVDVLWRYNGAGGRVRIWYMNGTALLSGADLTAVTDLNWQIAGTGDFNKDGNVDILWRYNGTGGRVRVWYMNGIGIIGGADLSAVPDLNWQVGGTGDFDKDGNVDILWRYNGAGGRNRIWYMNGIAIRSGADLLAVSDLNWQIGGVADYSGDGNVDVIWRYNGSGGSVYVWRLSGSAFLGTDRLTAVTDLNWKIVSR
jgi:hypothetical protein